MKVSFISLLDSPCFLLNQQDKKSEHKTEVIKTPAAIVILSPSIWFSGFQDERIENLTPVKLFTKQFSFLTKTLRWMSLAFLQELPSVLVTCETTFSFFLFFSVRKSCDHWVLASESGWLHVCTVMGAGWPILDTVEAFLLRWFIVCSSI